MQKAFYEALKITSALRSGYAKQQPGIVNAMVLLNQGEAKPAERPYVIFQPYSGDPWTISP
jgi:hypothetical protein